MSAVGTFLRSLLPGRKSELAVPVRRFLTEVREVLISHGFDVSEWSDEELWEAWFGFARIVAAAGLEWQEALEMMRRAWGDGRGSADEEGIGDGLEPRRQRRGGY